MELDLYQFVWLAGLCLVYPSADVTIIQLQKFEKFLIPFVVDFVTGKVKVELYISMDVEVLLKR